MQLVSEVRLYYPGNMTNRIERYTTSDKMWFIVITVKFSQKRDNATTIFEVYPPSTTPRNLRKELTFKTSSYKELCKWLKKNQDKVGKFINLKL